jgi:hypothetical protein
MLCMSHNNILHVPQSLSACLTITLCISHNNILHVPQSRSACLTITLCMSHNHNLHVPQSPAMTYSFTDYAWGRTKLFEPSVCKWSGDRDMDHSGGGGYMLTVLARLTLWKTKNRSFCPTFVVHWYFIRWSTAEPIAESTSLDSSNQQTSLGTNS